MLRCVWTNSSRSLLVMQMSNSHPVKPTKRLAQNTQHSSQWRWIGCSNIFIQIKNFRKYYPNCSLCKDFTRSFLLPIWKDNLRMLSPHVPFIILSKVEKSIETNTIRTCSLKSSREAHRQLLLIVSTIHPSHQHLGFQALTVLYRLWSKDRIRAESCNTIIG